MPGTEVGLHAGTTLDMQPRAQAKKVPKRKRSAQPSLPAEASLLSSFPLSNPVDWYAPPWTRAALTH